MMLEEKARGSGVNSDTLLLYPAHVPKFQFIVMILWNDHRMLMTHNKTLRPTQMFHLDRSQREGIRD